MIYCKHDDFRFFRDRNTCFIETGKADNGKPTVYICPNNHICHYWNNYHKKEINYGNFGMLRRRKTSYGSCAER